MKAEVTSYAGREHRPGRDSLRNWPGLSGQPLVYPYTALGGWALLVGAALHKSTEGLDREVQPFSQSHTAISGRT